MGHKVNPISFRLGIGGQWKSRWFNMRAMPMLLREDTMLRQHLTWKLKRGLVEKIEIERTANRLSLFIAAARPGLLIGRGGGGVEEIRRDIIQQLQKIRSTAKYKDIGDVRVEIQEVSKPDSRAQIVAQQVAEQLEKRMPFRSVLKRTLEKIMADKSVQGAKIKVAGRLGGAEMSNEEWKAKGKIPLHTLRANIDYAQEEAHTTYGVIGVKVWVYKGEVFGARTEKEERKEL